MNRYLIRSRLRRRLMNNCLSMGLGDIGGCAALVIGLHHVFGIVQGRDHDHLDFVEVVISFWRSRGADFFQGFLTVHFGIMMSIQIRSKGAPSSAAALKASTASLPLEAVEHSP